MDNILRKAIALLGHKEVERIRKAASWASNAHSPENIGSCQCNPCNCKRQGIDYFKMIAQNREDWIRRELERHKDELKREVGPEDQEVAG